MAETETIASDVPALSFVEPDESTAPINVCLYGPPGSGKSVAACSAPGPILILNAEGDSALRFARKRFGNTKLREVTFRGHRTLDALKQYDYADEQTVVVDSLGEVYDQLLREIAQGAQPTLPQYGKVNTILKDFVRFLRDLPVHLVVVCHEQIDDSDEAGPTRRPLTGGGKLPEAVMGMMDVVAYCSVLPGEKEDDPVRYVGQVVQARGRRAKDRSGALGPWRDLDLSEWVETIDAALRPTDLPWEDSNEKKESK